MNKKEKYLIILLGILISGVLIYLIYLNYQSDINMLLKSNEKSKEEIFRLVRKHNWLNTLFLVGLIAILSAIPGLSNSVFCILSGLSYGPLLGLVINWLGNMIGNCIVAKSITLLGITESEKKSKIMTYLMSRKNPEIGMTIGFMIPFVPSILVNYNAIRMQTPRRKYLTILAIGTFPTSFIYAFGGDALFKGDWKKIAGAIIAIGILTGISLILSRLSKRYKNKKVL